MSREIKRVGTAYDFIRYEHFAKSYLLIAKTALLTRSAETMDPRLSPYDLDRLNNGVILVPSIFCIRQSIEIFLKSIDVILTREFNKTHDLKILHKILSSLELDTETHNEIEVLVDKYYNYKFEPPLVKFGSNKTDVNNEVFRYPDNECEITLIGENLPLIETSDLLNDVNQIEKIFRKFSVLGQLKESNS